MRRLPVLSMRLHVALVALVALAACGTARADPWVTPDEAEYVSPDGGTRVVIVPRGVASRDAYLADAAAGVTPAGQRAGAPTRAAATLERRQADGSWRVVWTRPLPHDVAPNNAAVTDGGTLFATFDDWPAIGAGDTAVIIYGAAGVEIRRWAVVDIVGADVLAAMPASSGAIGSIAWRGHPVATADGDAIVLPVIVPTPMAHRIDEDCRADLDTDVDSAFVAFRITADGAIAPVDAAAWDAARAQAARTRACLERRHDRGD